MKEEKKINLAPLFTFDFDTIPENIIVVDHFELTIEKWLSKSQQLL